jgi:polyferredoxin
MEKVNRPKGLIRYASKNEIEKKVKSIFTPRAIGYTVVLVLLFGLLFFSLANRSNLEMSVLRTPGLLSQQQPGNKLSNIYDLKIMNKTFDKFPFQLKLSGIDGEIKILGENQVVPPQGVLEAKFLVILPEEIIHKLKTDISVEVLSKGKIIDKVRTAFIGNVKKERREKTEEKEED